MNKKQTVVLIVFVLMIFSSLNAYEVNNHQKGRNPQNLEVNQLICSNPENLNLKNSSVPINERSGCCSHHGGVCGCENGRDLCCDGNLSPTCGCD